MRGYFQKNICERLLLHFRGSHWKSSVKKGVLKNFANFTGKHRCWSISFNKVKGLQSATFLKRDSNKGAFWCSLRNF